MRLHPRPFEKISSGSKTIEIRLNDEKRQGLRVGDKIEFVSRANPENVLRAEIKDLVVFPSFKELCYAYPPIEYGSSDPEEYRGMYEHYSTGDETRYGAVAIKFALLPSPK